ncbi:hypothetical protein SLEP1_g17340 [Rubroshorea leprosula]|uniref:Uncharacterized protein n=1 Tax=Rubroshorea leprosula TaxID=152421 RepID=A0AAV5ITY7_9ROSI|nr:hypothetical protein SLEP1_g17340 [Rubroshorea leprosula]
MSESTAKSGMCSSNCSPPLDSMAQLKELYPFKNDQTPKVRKPYTITKQREKWTEEEHQKFLEALKLYGRGWRQIEEHVGTKTAVQIRSHAQKFFSKAAQESNGSSEGSIKPIEIPPPRPKRKPMHPYPRKCVDSCKGTSLATQLDPSSNELMREQENKSPTSVLSAFASDVLGSAVSEQQNACSSPTSCTTNIQSMNISLLEKESEYVTSNSSAEEEKVSLSSVQASAHSALEDFLHMRFNMGAKDSLCGKGDATSIKLFGKTVMVMDPGKPSPLSMENLRSNAGQENLDANTEMLSQTLPLKQCDTHISLGSFIRDGNSVPSGDAVYAYTELKAEKIDLIKPTPDAPTQWALHQGLPFYYHALLKPTLVQTPIDACVSERQKEKDILNERSCSGSNAGSVSQGENREKNSDSVYSLCRQQPCTEEKDSHRKCLKGFVPYKRCLVERDVSSSVVASEEQERQRARVCS